MISFSFRLCKKQDAKRVGLMTFSFFARDTLEVVHLCGCDWSANDLEILDDRLLVTRLYGKKNIITMLVDSISLTHFRNKAVCGPYLVINNKESESLNILELNEAKINHVPVFQIFWADFQLLNCRSSGCRIKI